MLELPVFLLEIGVHDLPAVAIRAAFGEREPHILLGRDVLNAHRLGDIVRVRKGLYAFGRAYRRRTLSREVLANLIHARQSLAADRATRGRSPRRGAAPTP